MFELLKIIATAGGAIIILVVGQLLQRLFIEPVQEFVKAKAKIANALTRHYSTHRYWHDNDGEVFEEDPEVLRKTAEELRSLSADLRSWEAVIPFYPVVAKVLRLPSRSEIKEATIALQQWAIVIYTRHDNSDHLETIDAALKLHTLWYFDHTGKADPRPHSSLAEKA